MSFFLHLFLYFYFSINHLCWFNICSYQVNNNNQKKQQLQSIVYLFETLKNTNYQDIVII